MVESHAHDLDVFGVQYELFGCVGASEANIDRSVESERSVVISAYIRLNLKLVQKRLQVSRQSIVDFLDIFVFLNLLNSIKTSSFFLFAYLKV